MAQFDSLIIFSLLWSLLLTLVLHYNVLLNIIIPNFFGVKKFREKSQTFYNFLNTNLGLTVNNSYNSF